MEDKEVEKLVVDYLDNKQFNMEKDLSKLKQVGLKQKKSFNFKPLIYSVSAIVLVLIISLSIILPNLNKGEQKYYFDDKQIEYVVVDDYSALHELMDNKALKPNVIGIQYTNKSITSKNDAKQIGIFSLILVYLGDFLEIKMHVLHKNYFLEEINVSNLQKEVKWNNTNVKFNQEFQSDINVSKVYLEYNGLQHYFEVKTAREFEIVELLDTLFTI